MKDYRPYDEASAIAGELLDLLRPACERIEIAGSLRRQCAAIGDLELVAIEHVELITDLFGEVVASRRDHVAEIITNPADWRFGPCMLNGPKHKSFTFQGFPVDLFIVEHATWGALFTIRTGNQIFSHWAVSQRRMGGGLPDHLYVQDGRVHNRNTGLVLLTPEETDFLALLGLAPDLPPEHPIRNVRDWAEIKQILTPVSGGAR